MRRQRRALALVWSLTLVAALGGKAVAVEQVVRMGSGTESCGTWLRHRADGPSADLQWVLGYLSGAATYTDGELLAPTDANGIWYWLDDYCRTHAAEPLPDALDFYVASHVYQAKLDRVLQETRKFRR